MKTKPIALAILGKARQHLKQGANVLAATSFLQYFRGKEGDIEVYLEGLEKLPPPER